MTTSNTTEVGAQILPGNERMGNRTAKPEAVCHLCGSPARLLFERQVLEKYPAFYFYCSPCDYIFAADPFWLPESYANGALVTTDTDVAVRNAFTALRLAALYYFAMPGAGKGIYLDAAGGYGLLTRLLRDLGFDCYWSDRYATNLFARGFEYSVQSGPCTAVSAVEVVEHTTNPLQFVRQTLEECGGTSLVFTTEVFPDGHPPAPDKWSYYMFDTGQHISFFSEAGLRRLADRLGLRYHRLGRLHLYTRDKLSGIRLRLASAKPLVIPLALFAAKRLGSRRNQDQSLLQARARHARPPG